MSKKLHAGWSNERFERSLHTAREGSYSAMGQLFDHYCDYLMRVAMQEIKPDLLAKVSPSDVVQETFLQATKAFPQFDGNNEAQLRGWLRKILLNNVLDAHRRYATQMRGAALEVPLATGDASSLRVQQLASRHPNPSSILVSAENRIKVQQALARLPDDYRRVIELRNFEDLMFEDIGQQMGRSTEAARRLWTRAIKRLTLELAKS